MIKLANKVALLISFQSVLIYENYFFLKSASYGHSIVFAKLSGMAVFKSYCRCFYIH